MTGAVIQEPAAIARCAWATSPCLVLYHDREWGVPVRDDRTLFEFLVLEGMQAGLSWETVLRKRDHYRAVFADFDPNVVATYGETEVSRLLTDPGIIRNRRKIEAAIDNARALLAVQGVYGSFATYVWGFVGGAPQQNSWQSLTQIPASTAASEAMSKDLRRRGFAFVGPTICYAFMQATGMVNDHLVTCFRHAQLRVER
jgi:DNA-3-methyladenine glycosylase I